MPQALRADLGIAGKEIVIYLVQRTNFHKRYRMDRMTAFVMPPGGEMARYK